MKKKKEQVIYSFSFCLFIYRVFSYRKALLPMIEMVWEEEEGGRKVYWVFFLLSFLLQAYYSYDNLLVGGLMD